MKYLKIEWLIDDNGKIVTKTHNENIDDTHEICKLLMDEFIRQTMEHCKRKQLLYIKKDGQLELSQDF